MPVIVVTHAARRGPAVSLAWKSPKHDNYYELYRMTAAFALPLKKIYGPVTNFIQIAFQRAIYKEKSLFFIWRISGSKLAQFVSVSFPHETLSMEKFFLYR